MGHGHDAIAGARASRSPVEYLPHLPVQPTNTIAGSGIAPAVEVVALDAWGNRADFTGVVTVSITAGTGSAVQVAAVDALGNIATGFSGSVTVAIATNPGGGALSGTTTVAAFAGIATFDHLSIDRTGTGYQLSAGAGGLTGATSAVFDIFT